MKNRWCDISGLKFKAVNSFREQLSQVNFFIFPGNLAKLSNEYEKFESKNAKFKKGYAINKTDYNLVAGTAMAVLTFDLLILT